MVDDRRLNRTDWLIAGAIFAIALAVRLVFLFTSPDRAWPHSEFYEGDAPTWVAWSNSLDRGQSFEFDLPLRSPAVAYLLSAIHPGQLPASFVLFKVLWCVFSAITCSLAFVAFTREFGRRIALIAGMLCTFSFGSYITATSLNNETLYTFALVLSVVATQRLIRRPSWLAAMLVGGLNGITMLIRFEHLAFLLLLAAYFAVRPCMKTDAIGNTRLLKRVVVSAIVVACAIAICLPWSIRGSLATQRFNTVSADVPAFESANPRWTVEAQQFIRSLPAFARDGNFRYITFLAQQSGKSQVDVQDVQQFFHQQFNYIPEPLSNWTLLSLKGPVDFALANHSQADGAFSKAALMREGDVDPTIMFGRPDHLKLFNHGYEVGLAYIRSEVGGWLTDVARKLSHFTDGGTTGFTSRNLPLGWTGERRPVDVFTASAGTSAARGAGLIGWKILIVASIVSGAVICVVQRRGGIWLLIIAYKLIVTIAFYGYARQAISIAPAFFILTAVAIDFFAQRLLGWREMRKTLLINAMALAVLFFVIIDVGGSLLRPELNIIGNVHAAPQWGPGAFESLSRLEIAPTGRAAPSP